MIVMLQAEKRNHFTKSEKHRLRQNGRIPAVVYGKKVPGTPLSVSEKQAMELLRGHPNALIRLEGGGISQTVVMKEIQKDPFTGRLLSLGFYQVERNDAVKVKVRIELQLEPQDKELEVQFLHQELEVQCLPDLIPVCIPVHPAPLREGRAVLVKDITVPDGVKLLLPPDEVVVAVLHVQAREAEPEVGE